MAVSGRVTAGDGSGVEGGVGWGVTAQPDRRMIGNENAAVKRADTLIRVHEGMAIVLDHGCVLSLLKYRDGA